MLVRWDGGHLLPRSCSFGHERSFETNARIVRTRDTKEERFVRVSIRSDAFFSFPEGFEINFPMCNSQLVSYLTFRIGKAKQRHRIEWDVVQENRGRKGSSTVSSSRDRKHFSTIASIFELDGCVDDQARESDIRTRRPIHLAISSSFENDNSNARDVTFVEASRCASHVRTRENDLHVSILRGWNPFIPSRPRETRPPGWDVSMERFDGTSLFFPKISMRFPFSETLHRGFGW